MKIDIESRPSYGMAVVTMNDGDSLVAESGAMVAMSSELDVRTGFNGTGKGGFLGWLQAAVTALLRRVLAGESMFVNTFSASADGQQVMLAPEMVGDVEKVRLDKDRVITVQATSYLASGKQVVVDLVWGGFQMLFSGEGAFFLKCSGKGPLLINAYGAIEKVEVEGAYVVDTGHLVAFEGDLTWRLKKVGGWKSTLLSGEGLVMEFKGDGTLWLQTRNLKSLVSWLIPQLPK